MNYTHCPIQPEQFNAPHFDKHQFADHGRFLRGSGLDFKDMQRMHLQPLADLRKSRKVETPSWVWKDEQFREVLVHYLEARYQMSNRKRSGSLKERLERCKAVGKERAESTKETLGKWVEEFRAISRERFSELPEEAYERMIYSALRGESPAERLRRVELQISCFDGEAAMSARAPELVTACAYLFYRLGWPSASVAEQLGLRPVHVRQIICRMNRAARRRAQGTTLKLGRPRRQNPSSVSGQIPEIKAA